MTHLGRRLGRALTLGLLSCLAALVRADVDPQVTSPRLQALAAAVASGDQTATDLLAFDR